METVGEQPMAVCVLKMRALAERFHAGQVRKGPDKRPYITHPAAVVAMLESWGVTDPCVLAAAWGHDLLEDTAVSESEIVAASSNDVLDCIRELTHRADVSKREYLHRLAVNGSERARIVKCADRLCNTLDFRSIGEGEYAVEYLSSADELFSALDRVPEPLRSSIRSSFDEVSLKIKPEHYDMEEIVDFADDDSVFDMLEKNEGR